MSERQSFSKPLNNAQFKELSGDHNLGLEWIETARREWTHQQSGTKVSVRHVASDDPSHRDDPRWDVDIDHPDLDRIVHPCGKQISPEAALAAVSDYVEHHPTGEPPETVHDDGRGRVPLEEVLDR